MLLRPSALTHPRISGDEFLRGGRALLFSTIDSNRIYFANKYLLATTEQSAIFLFCWASRSPLLAGRAGRIGPWFFENSIFSSDPNRLRRPASVESHQALVTFSKSFRIRTYKSV